MSDASRIKHTPSPWDRGVTLRTKETANWSKDQIDANDTLERKMVFSGFTSSDCGEGRVLVAKCETEEDACLVAAAPDLLSAAQEIFRTGLDEEALHGDQRQAISLLRAAIGRAIGLA